MHQPERLRALRIAGACAAAILTLIAATHAKAAEPLIFGGVSFEKLEYRIADGDDKFVYDGDAFIGTDENKLRLRGEGEYVINEEAFEKLETQLLYQRPVSDFFDAKAGIRADTPEGDDRFFAVLGVQGLAPQWFHVDLDFFIGDEADPSLRFDGEYELLITNRLILIPSAEIEYAFSDNRDAGIGHGLASTEIGLRLSYDVWDRAFSPYIGVVWERLWANTADLARDEGEDINDWLFVIGARLMF